MVNIARQGPFMSHGFDMTTVHSLTWGAPACVAVTIVGGTRSNICVSVLVASSRTVGSGESTILDTNNGMHCVPLKPPINSPSSVE